MDQQQGSFTKCENCLHKPATAKLYKKDTPYSLKVCFNCEKQLTNTEQYRHWLSQHLSYSSLKQPHISASQDVSKSFGVSSIDSVLKSPTFLSSRNYIPTSTQLESTYRNTGARLHHQQHGQIETPKTHQTYLSSHETHPSTTSRQKPLTTSYLVEFHHPDRMMTENNASVLEMEDHRPRIMDQKSPATRDFRKEFVKKTNIQVEDNLHHRDIPISQPLTTQHYVPNDHFGIKQSPKNPLSVHTKDFRPTAHFNDAKQRDSRNPLSSRLSHHNKRESYREQHQQKQQQQQPEKHFEVRVIPRESERVEMRRKERERQIENQDYAEYVYDSQQRRSIKRAQQQRTDIYIQRESERYDEEKEAQLRRERERYDEEKEAHIRREKEALIRRERERLNEEREAQIRRETERYNGEKEDQIRRERAELELNVAERETVAREEREEQIKFERNCREIARHYEEIIENIEFQIKEAERKNDKEIDDLRNEIYLVKDELHREQNIKENKINAESSKIYSKIQALQDEMHQELEGKRYLEDIFRQTKNDYEQELNKMKIKIEKIQADAVTEVEEIERNMKKQEEATNIALRDLKEDVDNHRLKSTKEHNAQLIELQTELDRIDTNIGKTGREGANEVNQGELKFHRAEEKIKQDETKMETKIVREAMEEKTERIKRMKQNIEDAEREAVIANNEIELLNQERNRLRIENKRLVGQYAKLNKIYLGK